MQLQLPASGGKESSWHVAPLFGLIEQHIAAAIEILTGCHVQGGHRGNEWPLYVC